MKSLIRIVAIIAAILPSAPMAEELKMIWGLENTWSYRETQRTIEQNLAWRPEAVGQKYRTFAFIEGNPEVNNLRFPCYDRHFTLWKKYQETITKSGGSKNIGRKNFQKFKSNKDPTCDQSAKQLAPVLYFDFVGPTEYQCILNAIEVTTLQYSEYRGGGFFKEEAWYDIVLSHKKGTKRYNVSRRLIFSGHGRCALRFWSDNFYENQGWIAPMGEYMIDIRFVFSVGDKEISVSTGPFKIDV